MLRLLGAGLTIASSTAIGFSICGTMRRRIRILQELRKMAVMLDSEIMYANSALEEAFGHIEKRLTAPVGVFLRNLRKRMEEGEHGLFGELFQAQMQQDLADSGLKKEDLESLGSLGGQLGYQDIHMQKKILEYYLKQVNDACIQAQQEYREKEKLFCCLGVGAGIFLVILFC